jgi:hypothetical protein
MVCSDQVSVILSCEDSLRDSLSKSPWNIPNLKMDFSVKSCDLLCLDFSLVIVIDLPILFLSKRHPKFFAIKKQRNSQEDRVRTYAASCMYLSYSLLNDVTRQNDLWWTLILFHCIS